MNYKEAYERGAERLKESGVPDAQLDARLLLEAVCGTKRHDLFAHQEKIITEEEEKKYNGYILQRQSRIPLQYLLGEQDFMGLSFLVTPDVLIPRQDTEILVETVMRHLHDGMRILDMCTGSGCILLSLLHYSNDCTGVGADASWKALEIAKKNAKRLNLSAEWIEGDLFERVEGIFDMIVSNPPYIPPGVIETLMPEVKDFEPLTALDGGEDGYVFYRRIIREAGRYLSSGGMLFLEIGYEQAEAVKELLLAEEYSEINVVKDFSGNDRVVFGTFGK